MKKKILIVDDQPDIVLMLTDRLEALGYETVAASNGKKALEKLDQDFPHLMLLDLEMPEMTGMEVLQELGLPPLDLLPKEGLALVNGTSFSSAIAANCVYESRQLLCLSLAANAMMLRALCGREEPFDAFVHQAKPHPGQVWTAQVMRELLHSRAHSAAELNGSDHVQDRYSLRCLPQYLGPIVEGIARVSHVVATEMNSVTDNPLIFIDDDSGATAFEARLAPGPGDSRRRGSANARWRPDGKAIAFLGFDPARGRVVIFEQDFDPRRDTGTRRRTLLDLGADAVPESFAYAPDGLSVAVADPDGAPAILIVRRAVP